MAAIFCIICLFLSGCASVVTPVTPSAVVSCELDDNSCFQLGTARFEHYRQEKRAEITQKSNGYRLPGAPAAFLHPARTEYAVLLVHGRNDSAYYMGDIAAILKAYGFNVLTILLPGHGTDTQDMLTVTAEQWQSEVERGIAMASLVGQKVIVGGFSLGGALSINAALRRADIHGLLLFSPAVKLRSYNSISGLTCLPGLRGKFVETALPRNPVKYTFRAGNGVCQLSRMINSNLASGENRLNRPSTFNGRLLKMGERLTIPTFVALTYADARISPEAVLAWADRIKGPVTVATFGTAEHNTAATQLKHAQIVHISDENLAHSFLVRQSNEYNAQENPSFDAMAILIEQFLRQHFRLNATAD